MKKRMPCMTLFIMKLVLPKSGKAIAIDKQFFYSIKTDILYSRSCPADPWKIECNGEHHKDMNCPVENPEKFMFKELGSIIGTQLSKNAVS